MRSGRSNRLLVSSDYQSVDIGKRREKEREDDPHGERVRPLGEGREALAVAGHWKKRKATGKMRGSGRPLEGKEGYSHWSSSSSFACIFVDTCLNFTLHASMLHSRNKKHDTALTGNPMLTSMLDISSYFG